MSNCYRLQLRTNPIKFKGLDEECLLQYVKCGRRPPEMSTEEKSSGASRRGGVDIDNSASFFLFSKFLKFFSLIFLN